MAIKCISGVIEPKRTHRSQGSFVIDLLSGHSEETSVAKFSEMAMFGTDSKFTIRPCLNISLRHVYIRDSRGGAFSLNGDIPTWIELSDNLMNQNSQLRVSWSCSPTSFDGADTADNRFSEVLEISVLVIGEN